ncbi:MAG: membrane protein [Saprospiraceae bacterium]|nr:MAG: membrane protein [Saprospiraceae bacterium]
MRIIISLLLNALAVYVLALILPGVHISDYWEAILVAIFLGLANAFIKPILTFLTLPITILTLGLFLLLINGAIVLLVDWLLDGFSVDGWLWAIIYALLLALINGVLGGRAD